MIELEAWKVIVLMVLPLVTMGVGLWMGRAHRRESVRALEKSLEDARRFAARETRRAQR